MFMGTGFSFRNSATSKVSFSSPASPAMVPSSDMGGKEKCRLCVPRAAIQSLPTRGGNEIFMQKAREDAMRKWKRIELKESIDSLQKLEKHNSQYFTAEMSVDLAKQLKQLENLTILIKRYENENSVSDDDYDTALLLEKEFAKVDTEKKLLSDSKNAVKPLLSAMKNKSSKEQEEDGEGKEEEDWDIVKKDMGPSGQQGQGPTAQTQ
ncbi:hypothetical protein ONS96_013999 [Cadophora gregata f. sp. sojae]|nr:hypothetical protein ONS96_013999 [Cadophora gregata f. sp. sojae]